MSDEKQLERIVEALKEISVALGSVVAKMDAAPAPARKSAATGKPDLSVFPPYGRNKGGAVVGATMQDLEFYAAGERRTLGDPSKSRFHQSAHERLMVFEDEIRRQGGTIAEPAVAETEEIPF